MRAHVPFDGSKLYQQRLARRMSTATLARAAETTPGHIRLLERGVRGVSVELLDRLEKALDVTPDAFKPDDANVRPLPRRKEPQ